MNKELIDGFIKQAACLEQTTIPIDNFAFHVQDFEKFAELIVFECIDAIIEGDPDPKLVLSPVRRAIIDDIKVRFGWSD